MARALRIHSFRPTNWFALVTAYWWLFRARWRMNRSEARDILKWNMDVGGPLTSDTTMDSSLIRRRVRFINFAAHYPFPWARCLQRSMALREWLAKEGVCTLLRVGVRKSNGELQAHAWLEYKGRVINDYQNVNQIFVPFTVNNMLPTRGKALGSTMEWMR